MKKLEYRLNIEYDLRVCGEVPFTMTFENLHWEEYSSLNFQANLSGGAHVYWSLRPTAYNIAKSNDTW